MSANCNSTSQGSASFFIVRISTRSPSVFVPCKITVTRLIVWYIVNENSGRPNLSSCVFLMFISIKDCAVVTSSSSRERSGNSFGNLSASSVARILPSIVEICVIMTEALALSIRLHRFLNCKYEEGQIPYCN